MTIRQPTRLRAAAAVLAAGVCTALTGCGGDDGDSGGTAAGSGTIAKWAKEHPAARSSA